MKLRDVLNELARHQLPLSDVAGAATVPQLSSKCVGRQLPATAAPAGMNWATLTRYSAKLNHIADRLTAAKESDRSELRSIASELESILNEIKKASV